MCPLLFNGLTMSLSNALCEVKGVLCLAIHTMARKVEFRDQVRELEVIDIEVQVVLREMLEVMDRPFTSNVI